MLLSKRCPKCGGNLLIGSDLYGRYATCMQCGRGLELPRLPRERVPVLAGFDDLEDNLEDDREDDHEHEEDRLVGVGGRRKHGGRHQ